MDTTDLGKINFITLHEWFSTNDTCTKFEELLSHVAQSLNIKIQNFLKKESLDDKSVRLKDNSNC